MNGTPRATNAPRWAEWVVRFLDDGLVVPGTSIRFGADALLGALLPGVGDGVSAVGSLSLFLVALRRGVPPAVLGRMVLNVGLDALVGVVPVLGDLFDVGFKSNRRNLELIHAHGTEQEAEVTLRSRLLVFGAIALAACLLAIPPVVMFFVLRALFEAKP